MSSNAHHIGKKEKVSRCGLLRVMHDYDMATPTEQTADYYLGAGVEAACCHSRFGCGIDVTVSLFPYFRTKQLS